ncbi:SNARE-like domain protein [Agrilactobacillus composti DSM 18527 = JCM 14202]|uniref:TVP38/TMEM64 family membrane protein n=1 Tax=Agrilactobacillus composti DSM 18527 = JCM 14202 TaxID=1423734 RepID=A0A0R1XM34_9LACO|nr:TVP38/TMEM64 family protein [Agrilactobacillus composti]KRM30645.1 SNARE-like domain protein [Agrilactobacillus composti DSM 18527 = JCM 14202]
MKRILIFLAILLSGFYLAYTFGLWDLLTNLQDFKHLLVASGWQGYIWFIVLSILVSVFLLPGQLLALVGGMVYGGLVGGILTVVGATLGAAIAFVLGKYVARDYIVQHFGQRPVFQKIEQGVLTNGTTFLVFTRLVPIFPYAIQSYAYALTPMSLGKFTLISFITMMPASFIYTFMAAEIVKNGVSWKLLLELTIAGLLLALLTLLPKRLSPKIRQLNSEYKSKEKN